MATYTIPQPSDHIHPHSHVYISQLATSLALSLRKCTYSTRSWWTVYLHSWWDPSKHGYVIWLTSKWPQTFYCNTLQTQGAPLPYSLTTELVNCSISISVPLTCRRHQFMRFGTSFRLITYNLADFDSSLAFLNCHSNQIERFVSRFTSRFTYLKIFVFGTPILSDFWVPRSKISIYWLSSNHNMYK